MIHRLLQELGDQPDAGRWLASRGGRRLHAVQVGSHRRGRAVWALFARARPTPVVVLKVDHHPALQRRLAREYRALQALDGRAALQGTVPRPLALFHSSARLVLAQTGLPGAPLTVVARQRLRARPRRSAQEQRVVLEWLRRLQGDGPWEVAPVDGTAVMDRLGAVLGTSAERFVARVGGLARDWPSLAVPLVPGHGDLGPSNCLLRRGSVGVVDWEGGEGARTALADLVMFLNHYARAQPVRGHRPPERVQAFRGAFLDDGWLARLTAASFARHLRHLRLPLEAAEYLLVATLADLATGTAPTANAAANRRYWATLLGVYAEDSGAAAVRRLAEGRDGAPTRASRSPRRPRR